MQPETTLNYICAYDNTDMNKELKLDANSLTITSADMVHLQIPLAEINSAVFSANYVKLVTPSGSHVIRGIKPHDYSPALARNSLSDTSALKSVREFLEAKGVRTSFQLFVVDKKVLKR
jgi:hypothetical protein